MDEPVALLLLQRLFQPEWSITCERHGLWKATGRILFSASSVDGLIDMIKAADPETVERATSLLREH